MTKPLPRLVFCCAISTTMALLVLPTSASGHGFSGKRFFPATLVIDDPFVSDEFSFVPGYLEGPDQESTDLAFAFSKRITQDFGLEFEDAYRIIKPRGTSTQDGFANFEVGAKYQFLTNDPHETILSVGLSGEIGNTGSHAVGSESFSVISPRFFFGKGLGDLPDSLKYLKPLAITGTLGPDFPTDSRSATHRVNPRTGEVEREVELNSNVFTWGFAVEYSLQYLQAYVEDMGLGTPLDRMVLVLELPIETCLDRGCGGETTGFVNPGVIWFGKSLQLGLEARIPINSETNTHVGVVGMVHLFMDDLFPTSLGRPIFP